MDRTEIVNKTERANSFEFGAAGQRHKVYYEDFEDMQRAINTALQGELFLATQKAKMTEVKE